MKVMEIGRLNKKIQFLTYEETIDELGQNKQSFVAKRRCWADLYPVRGQERYEAIKAKGTQAKVEQIQYKCYVRFFEGLTSSNFYLKYKGRLFSLDSVIDIDNQHTFYEIYCTEVIDKKVKANVNDN